MELAKETRERIFTAADSLYEQAGRAAFPTVDAVRKTARVNMNDASAGMKEWRRSQTAQADPVAVSVPDAVQRASSAALAALWQEAQELANESLRAAQAGWEAERVEADTLTKQMADAYETVAAELEASREEVGRLIAAADRDAATKQRLDAELAETGRELAGATAGLQRAEVRAIEIERRADDLRMELDHAHQEASQLRAELSGVRQAHASEVDALRTELKSAHARAEATGGELATVKAKAEAQAGAHEEQRKEMAQDAVNQVERVAKAQAEREQAKKEAGQAREEAARLRGQVDAIKEQNAQLMKSVARPEKPVKAGGKQKED